MSATDWLILFTGHDTRTGMSLGSVQVGLHQPLSAADMLCLVLQQEGKSSLLLCRAL